MPHLGGALFLLHSLWLRVVQAFIKHHEILVLRCLSLAPSTIAAQLKIRRLAFPDTRIRISSRKILRELG